MPYSEPRMVSISSHNVEEERMYICMQMYVSGKTRPLKLFQKWREEGQRRMVEGVVFQ
jgi:hypothetical protein